MNLRSNTIICSLTREILILRPNRFVVRYFVYKVPWGSYSNAPIVEIIRVTFHLLVVFMVVECTVAQWLALLPHSKKVLGSFPAQPGPFCVEFACSPRVCVGFLRVLRFPPTSKDMHRQCTMYMCTAYEVIVCKLEHWVK